MVTYIIYLSQEIIELLFVNLSNFLTFTVLFKGSGFSFLYKFFFFV